MDQITVTGGAGFIGSHLVRRLLLDGSHVTILDNFSTGSRENLEDVLSDVDLHEGDLRSPEDVKAAVSGSQVVFHLGALPSVPRSIQDPLTTHEVNSTGTLNVLLAAKDSGVERVVLVSSSSVYGRKNVLPLREDMPVSPLSPYAASKVAAEHYGAIFSEVYGLSTVILRFFNVFGPRQDPNSPYSAVIPLFMQRALDGEQITICGDGSHSRDFTHVDNVIQGCLLAATQKGVDGQIFNIARGERHTILDLAKAIENLLEDPLGRTHVSGREGEVPHSTADIEKARRMLGYAPIVSFENGLATVWSWLREATTP